MWHLIRNLDPLLEGLTIIAQGVGPGQDELSLLLADEQTGLNTALLLKGEQLQRTPLDSTGGNLVQPLADGEVLVASSRCAGQEPNAHIFGPDGACRRSFRVGDGVADLQVDPTHKLWASYTGLDREGVGSAGLHRFDPVGELLYSFQPPPLCGPVYDCYALNVDSDAVWLCYYADFSIVRVGYRRLKPEAWRNKVNGARALAVHEDLVLLFGGYGEHAQRLVLLEMRKEGRTTRQRRQWELALPGAGPAWVRGRGPLLHLVQDQRWYTLDLRTLD